MASINRRLKKGMNAHCSIPGSVEKKGEDADVRAPRCSERGRGKRAPIGGPYCAVRGGKAEPRGLSARSGLRHWAACASRARAGSWAANGPTLGVSAGCAGLGFGAGPKSVKGLKIKGKFFYIFQNCKFV